MTTLTHPTPPRYDHRQVAAWMRWAFLPMAVGAVVVVIAVGASGAPLVMGVLAATLFLAIGWSFSTLRVTLYDHDLRVAFGPGWPRKILPLAQVASVEVVRNRWWWGFGIRWTPDGWMWNVSGLDAVLLRRTGGRSFRVGTDDPQGLCDAIRGALDARPHLPPGLAS